MNKYFPNWEEADEVIFYIAENLEINVIKSFNPCNYNIVLLSEEKMNFLKHVIIPTEYIEDFDNLYESFVNNIFIEMNILDIIKDIYLKPDNEETRYYILNLIKLKIKELENNTQESIRTKFIKHMGSNFAFFDDNTQRQLFKEKLHNIHIKEVKNNECFRFI